MIREETGIKVVDSMIEGGFPSGSIIGLSGPPGVGKSIFTLHFLLDGARKGQKCVYINLEEPKTNIDNMIAQFDFSEEFLGYVKKGKIVLKCYNHSEYEKIYKELLKKIKEDGSIKRLVIDSFNCFFSSAYIDNDNNLSSELSIRRSIDEIFSILRRKNLTTLMTLEIYADKQISFYYNLPYIVDGFIDLDFLELGTIERRIFIPKMRWTNQYKESKSFEINKKGIVIEE